MLRRENEDSVIIQTSRNQISQGSSEDIILFRISARDILPIGIICAFKIRRKTVLQTVFLVPKPGLGNASAPEAPASVRLPSREAGASPASAFPSRGLGTRKAQIMTVARITQ